MPLCEVVGVANRVPDRKAEPYYYFESFVESLRRFDAAPSVIGLGEPWGGLMTIPRRVRQWLRAGMCRCEILIFSNCFDVVFTAPPDEVAVRWKYIHGDDVVTFNAEKGLFPRGDLAHAFPDLGSPWRYLNSGLYIGRPERILAMLDMMNLDDITDDHPAQSPLHGDGQVNTNDQGWFQFLFAAARDSPVQLDLDVHCDVFQSFSACTFEEFDLSQKDKIVNRVTGTSPLVLHLNGASKNEMLPDLCRKFGVKL